MFLFSIQGFAKPKNSRMPAGTNSCISAIEKAESESEANAQGAGLANAASEACLRGVSEENRKLHTFLAARCASKWSDESGKMYLAFTAYCSMYAARHINSFAE